MKIGDLHSKFLECSSVCTDTRKLTENCLYVALKGEHFDGNTFAKQALANGAKYAVVDNPAIAESEDYILVDDTLQVLQQLANYHKKQIDIPIIALTGSNGKTTTKELIHAVLKTTYAVKATIGNLNNHIGVPLSLLCLEASDDMGIIEMGANHQKEIEFLCTIAEPNYGLITNFGKAHLEGFGGVEGVIKGKSELYQAIRSHEGTAFINTNDPLQIRQIGDYSKVVRFGSESDNAIVIEFIDANPFVHVLYKDTEIKSQLIGDYNFSNIAIAIALGDYLKVPVEQIKVAIESYVSSNNRSQILEINSNTIILDAYNANPTSMKAAIDNFKQLDGDHKVLFLGDMFELGEDAAKEHQAIVDTVEHYFDSPVYLCGEHFYSTTTRKPNLSAYRDFESLKSVISRITFENTKMLIKGSRGMALERVLDLI
ncbi:MAG: UDP-N-acetylmuramoyl-tripeptide--D-alanyl-D-alanine ligase [Bacteroidota bacterium]